MPLRKNVSSLRSCCIDNIARNVVQHGELFRKSKADTAIYVHYKTLQLLFTDALVAKLFAIFSGSCSTNESLKELQRFLFRSEERGHIDAWPCLALFFNEHTTSISQSLNSLHTMNCDTGPMNSDLIFKAVKNQISAAVMSYITNECKNLTVISDTFSFLAGANLEAATPAFKNLVEVHFDRNSQETVKNILRTCYVIRKLTASGECVSDKCLLSLCDHRSQSTGFTFCPDNGNCTKAGKCLEILQVPFFDSSAEGIACALQHLPAVKTLGGLPLKNPMFKNFLPDISGGIKLLQRAAVTAGPQETFLELRVIALCEDLSETELSIVSMNCPKLEILQVDLSVFNTSVFSVSLRSVKELHFLNSSNDALNSPQLKTWLSEHGAQIRAVCFIGCSEELDLTHITCISYFCSNLKRLDLQSIRFLDRNYDHLGVLSSCRQSIEKISIIVPENFFPLSCRDYFEKLLWSTTNLKFLEIGWSFAENEFLHVLEKNGFNCLEEFSILYANTTCMFSERLLDTCENIKKIQFYGEVSWQGFLYCKELVRKRNYELDVLFHDWYFYKTNYWFGVN